MECIAVDWSGALTGAADRIWIARATDGVLTALDAPGSRDAVRDQLLDRLSNATPCLCGLDFAFSVPGWFARQRGWTQVEQVWAAARDEGEAWLRDCPSPFWGRPGVPRAHPVEQGLRLTERTTALGSRPKSVLQIGGAGSVGTGSIRGMPMLLTLRDAGWAVWPFDVPRAHTLTEIYPRHFTGPVVKRSPDARAALLGDVIGDAAPAELRTRMAQSEDAFDAGVSAVMMSRRTRRGIPWPALPPETALEGAIWAPEVSASARRGS
jgi:hypothetical protein